jgi:hypothetical protein
MPTFTTVDANWDTGVTLDAAELRRGDTAMFLGDGANNGVRGGIVRHGDTSLAVTVNGSDQVTVQPGAFVIPAATGLGVYRGALSAAVGPTGATALTARNGTNPRIDLIVIQMTGTNATLKTIDGTPGSSPSAPALPAQHIELARVTVPQVGGGAVTVDSSFRTYATALGGRLLAESLARLPGSGNQKGQRATTLDNGRDFRWNGTAWVRTTDGFLQSGTYSHVYAGATQLQTRSVTFPEAFTGPPNVVITPADERFTYAVKNVTATGFDVVTSYTLGAVVAGFNMNIAWLAHL